MPPEADPSPARLPGDDSRPSARDRHTALYREIRARICLLDYPPGMRLSETAMAREFGTSRTPLRRVLARLEDEGLLRSVHGVGTFVTDVSMAELEQAYRLRLELVALTSTLDAVAPDQTFLRRLDHLISRSIDIQTSKDPRAFTRLDMDVFQLFLDLTANQPLRQVMERLYYQTKRIWLTAALGSHLEIDEEMRIFHRELVDIRMALAAGDLGAAAQLQRAHISMSFNRLRIKAR